MVKVAGTLQQSSEVMRVVNDMMKLPAMQEVMMNMSKGASDWYYLCALVPSSVLANYPEEITQKQCFCFRQHVSWVTPKIVKLYHAWKCLWDSRIPKISLHFENKITALRSFYVCFLI